MSSVILTPNDISQQDLIAKNRKNSLIATCDGNDNFGIFPQVHEFPSGNIYLKLGYAGYYKKGRNSPEGAFGLRHIWDKHRNEFNGQNALDIISFVETIITTGADIIVDLNKDPNKPLVVESSVGMAVLKPTIGNTPSYSIITAYTRKQHPGVLIGNL